MNQRVLLEIARRRELEEARARRLQLWAQGGSCGPFKMMFFPTNACNMNCSICWQRKGVQHLPEIPRDRQVRMFEEMIDLDVQELVIGGGGEPLLRWHGLEPLMRSAKAHGTYGMLFTNGTQITDEIASALVDMQWNKVLISLDGLQDINDRVRQEGSFQLIMAGLDRLLAARGGRMLPVVGVSFVLTKDGIDDLPAVVQVLAERGCDQLNLVRLIVHLSWQRKFALPARLSKGHQENLREASERLLSAGMLSNLNDFMNVDILQHSECFEKVLLSGRTRDDNRDPFWSSLCFEPFTNLVIHADGAVGPCCMSGDAPLASVVSRSLPDVWFGTEMSALREGIKRRIPEPYCRICDLNVFYENQRLRNLGRSL